MTTSLNRALLVAAIAIAGPAVVLAFVVWLIASGDVARLGAIAEKARLSVTA